MMRFATESPSNSSPVVIGERKEDRHDGQSVIRMASVRRSEVV